MKTLLTLVLAFSMSFSAFAQSTPQPAESVMKQAYAKAGNENKKVLLIFHASWCSWCRKMEASINDPACRKFFDDNYVITYLDVKENPDKRTLENPGGDDLMDKYNAGKSGLPFWLILDAKGKALAYSEMHADGTPSNSPADNVGCPATEKEVDFFVNILKSTSKLTDNDLSIIKTRFRKNEPVKTATGTN